MSWPPAPSPSDIRRCASTGISIAMAVCSASCRCGPPQRFGVDHAIAVNVLPSMPLNAMRAAVRMVRLLAPREPAPPASKCFAWAPNACWATLHDAIVWDPENARRWIDRGQADAEALIRSPAICADLQPARAVSFKIDYSMPMYRVYRMKDAPRQQFRWAPHVAGAAGVKAKDYEPDGEVQADSEYDAWIRLRASERPLAVGDLLGSRQPARCASASTWASNRRAGSSRKRNPRRRSRPSSRRRRCRFEEEAHAGTALRRHHRRLLHQVQAHHEPRGGVVAERRARQGSLPDVPQRSRLPARAAAST